MNQAQQTALEGLAGLSFTADQIAAIDPFLDPENRNDVQIAALINGMRAPVQRPLPVETVFTILFASGDWPKIRASTEAIATAAFNALADAKQFGGGVVDLTLDTTKGMLAGLQAKDLLSQKSLDDLASASIGPADPIPFNQVSDVLNVAEGRLTL